MKKLTLLLSLFTVTTFGQSKREMPVFPGCEKQSTPKALLDCFNSYIRGFTKTYFLSYHNALDYFQYPDIDNKIYFKINKNGRFDYESNYKESDVFNLMGNDFIKMYNMYLDYNKMNIVPGKDKEGKEVSMKFSMPIHYDKEIKPLKRNTDILRFTIDLDQRYIIKEDANYNFIVYNDKSEKVNEINSITDFYSTPIFNEIVKSDKNLITEQTINGKKIKLEVYNLFKNQSESFKISYFENDKLIKEFSSMDKFLNSVYSEYIY